MTPKEEQAKEYFSCGYSCAQSVFAAFHQEIGLEEDVALKMMLSVGGGIGGLREICGAFVAASIAINMIRSDLQKDDLEDKRVIYAIVQDMAEKFKAEHDTVICRELLEANGITPSPIAAERTKEYYASRPCIKFVQTCARLVEEEISKQPTPKEV